MESTKQERTIIKQSNLIRQRYKGGTKYNGEWSLLTPRSKALLGFTELHIDSTTLKRNITIRKGNGGRTSKGRRRQKWSVRVTIY